MRSAPKQSGVNIFAPIKIGHEADLRQLLTEIDDKLLHQELVPFASFTNLHFFRWCLLEKDSQSESELLLSACIDGSAEDFLKTLCQKAPQGMQQIYSHCEGAPEAPEELLPYLLSHLQPEGVFYQGHPGVTAAQIHQDHELRERLGSFCDLHSFETPESTYRAIRDHLGKDEKKKLRPSPNYPLFVSTLEWLALFLGLTLFLPAFLVVAPLWLLFLRIAEINDDLRVPLKESERMTPDRILALCREDLIIQNQFTHLVDLKKGWLRLTTLRIILVFVNLAGRIGLARKYFLGISTLHFVQWMIVDEGKRLLFLSNYDGTAIKYVGDFVDRSTGIPLALTAIWSNTVGFPKTDFLINGGAKNHGAFLSFLRRHQVHSQVWYSAYPEITASNILNSEQCRNGLVRPLSNKQLQSWIKTL